jgi:MFS transporter, PAT family, beta-lactamase induction signal transducer AmpG
MGDANHAPIPGRRRFIFALLYFSEGCPIGFIWWAVPTWLRTHGLDLGTITALTAMLVLPWTLKFLWAPLIDGCRTRRWGYRAWIVSMQLLMGFALLPLLTLAPAENIDWLKWCLLVHALAAATQDVAIDALAIRSVPAEQRGSLNGWMQAGMLGGRSLFGGGAILALAFFGQAITSIMVWWLDEPEAPAVGGVVRADLWENLAQACRGKTFWIGIAFALTSAAAFEGVGAMAGPFLLDHGVSEKAVGIFYGIPVVLATVVGGLVGGKLSDVLGRRRAVASFLLAFVGCVLLLASLDAAAGDTLPGLVWMVVLGGLYLCLGLFVAASYALYMDLTDPRVGGTQFSTFMAATNGCESWSAWAGGRMASGVGYAVAFVGLSVVSLTSLALLRWLPRSSKTSRREGIPGAG